MAVASEHTGSLSWGFSGFKLRTFLSSKNGDEFVSETFAAGAFKFQCKMYPNGRKKEQKGCVMLYFILQTSLGNKISKITVNARLYCPETLCDWRHIQHLTKDNAGIGWHSKNMLLSEIQNTNYLKFICEISIVRIEYNNNTNIYHKLTKMNTYTKNEWIINKNSKLFESFKTAHNGKFYHSIDYNNGCWCSSIAPNGSNSKDINNVKVGLQLLQLPPFISRIKAKFSIISPLFDLKCHGKKEFTYSSTFIAWADGTLNTKTLLNAINNNEKLSFISEIIILKAYDEYDKEISKTNWFKYGLINNSITESHPMQKADSINTDISSNYNLLSPSITQMSVLSPINITSSDGSDGILKEANEEEDTLEYDDDEKESINSFNHLLKNQKPSKHLYSKESTNSSLHSHSYSKDISSNLELIHSQKQEINELNEKLEEIEIYKTEDEKHLISMEKSIIDLQKSYHNLQQQQFDQNAIFKQYINELSLNNQRLTNEVIFLRNKLNNIEIQMDNHQIQIFENIQIKSQSHHSNSNSNVSNVSPKMKNKNSSNRNSNSSKSSTRSDRKQAKKSSGKIVVHKKDKNNAIKISSALASWIKHECGLPQYVKLFAENGYDSFEIVKEMSKLELNEIGIRLKGHQFKIMKEIKKLQHTQKHHRTIGGTDGINHLKMINYLTPVASPAGSDSQINISNDFNKPILTPTNDKSNTYSHSKLILNNLNSKTITATATATATTTATIEQKQQQNHKHSSSYAGTRHFKQITPIQLTFGSNTLSPSHSQSMSMTSYTTQSITANNTFAWNNNNKKPMLLESPTNFSHNNNNYNIGYPLHPQLYDSRSIKKGYHNQILPMPPQIPDMWECKSCHNSNGGTGNKCEFCQHQR